MEIRFITGNNGIADESTCDAIDEVYAESCDRLRELGIAIPASG